MPRSNEDGVSTSEISWFEAVWFVFFHYSALLGRQALFLIWAICFAYGIWGPQYRGVLSLRLEYERSIPDHSSADC